MQYIGIPMGMWYIFRKSFQNNLVTVMAIAPESAGQITAKSKIEYKKLIAKLPEFEKKDRFKMNIVSSAMFAAFLLNISPGPDVNKAAEYYGKAMMIPVMKWFCRKSAKRKFSSADVRAMQETARLKAADRNPYSWNMDYYAYEDGSGYEARFTKCGICTLMKELGLFMYVPAMCRLDDAMSRAGGVSVFVRQYTLASGGPFCDCGYKRKDK